MVHTDMCLAFGLLWAEHYVNLGQIATCGALLGLPNIPPSFEHHYTHNILLYNGCLLCVFLCPGREAIATSTVYCILYY